MTSKKILTLFVSLTLSLNAFAGDKDEVLKKALVQFQQGAYSKAFDMLSSIKGAKDLEVSYWQGVCAYKLQKFEVAAGRLKKVVGLDKNKTYKDAAYLLGQSYYAMQEFKAARDAFQLAADSKYKYGTSLYYIGYVSGVLKEDKKALATYEKIVKLPDSDSDMRQPASFQIGELYYQKAQSTKDKRAQKAMYTEQVVPAYKRTLAMNEESAVGKQAKGRLAELGSKMSADVPVTGNGSPIPAQPWVLRVTQDFKYDTNIVNQSDNKLQKVSFTGSPLEKTGVFGKYEYIMRDWLALTPELSADLTLHGRRSDSTVYSNDNSSVNPAIRGRLDHRFNGNPAAGLVETEFAWSNRDYTSTHSFSYYSNSVNFVLGERAKLIPFGDTTLKVNMKLNKSQNSGQNYFAPSVNLSQNWAVYKAYVLNTGFNFEEQSARNEFYDQRTYRVNASFGIPNLFWSTNLDLAMSETFTDTMHQYDTRGTEITTNPSLTLTKNVDTAGKLTVNLNYGFTRNSSLDTVSYAYTKHIIGLGTQYTF